MTGLAFLFGNITGYMLLFGPLRGFLVAAFGRCQIAQQLARSGIRRMFRGLFIEVARRAFHPGCLAADLFNIKALDQPDGPARKIARHMFAAHQRDWSVETAFELVDEEAPMMVLLLGHLVEDLGCCRIIVTQPRRVGSINPAVIFLVRDREGQDFLFREVRESFSVGEELRKHQPSLERFQRKARGIFAAPRYNCGPADMPLTCVACGPCRSGWALSGRGG